MFSCPTMKLSGVMLICIGSHDSKVTSREYKTIKIMYQHIILLFNYTTLAFSLRVFVALIVDEESVCHELNS